MADSVAIAGAGVPAAAPSSLTVANERKKKQVFLHYLPNSPAIFHVIEVDSYDSLMVQLRQEMLQHPPVGGWGVSLHTREFGLCHVVEPEEDEDEHVERAVRAVFMTNPPLKVSYSKPLFEFVGVRDGKVCPPRFVVIGSAVPVEHGYSESLVVTDSVVRVLSATFRAVTHTAAEQLLYNAIIRSEGIDVSGPTDKHHYIRLKTPGAKWFHACNETLFVRDTYPCLFDLIVADWHTSDDIKGEDMKREDIKTDDIKGVVLVGQPGIGSSVLGEYLLYRFLSAGWAVFYMPHAGLKTGFLFMEGRVYRGDQACMEELHAADDDKLLGNTRLVSILDARLTSNVGSPIISITSPGQIREYKYRNLLHKYQRMVIPVPSRSEMFAMRKIVFPKVNKEDMKRRMELWGCIPRSVFVDVLDEDQKAAWSDVKSVQACEISDAMSANSTENAAYRCHRIIQERCRGQDIPGLSKTEWRYYMPGHIEFVSEVLGAWACKMFANSNTWELWNMAVSSAGRKALAGSNFASLFWYVLQQDTSFEVQQLGPKRNNSMFYNLKAEVHKVFHSMDELAALAKEVKNSEKATLLTPSRRNLCDLDGILVKDGCPNFFRAIQTGQQHTVNGAGLTAATAAFGWDGHHTIPWSPKAVQLYLFVPEKKFEYVTQPVTFHSDDKTELAPALVANTQQFAVCLSKAAIIKAFEALASCVTAPAALLPPGAAETDNDTGDTATEYTSDDDGVCSSEGPW